MGLCLSSVQHAPSQNGQYDRTRPREVTPPQLPARPSTQTQPPSLPPRTQRVSHPALPPRNRLTAAPLPQTPQLQLAGQSDHRHIYDLASRIEEFSFEQQNSLRIVCDLEIAKHEKLTNAKRLARVGTFQKPSADDRQALRRQASFLVVSDLLEDIPKAADLAMDPATSARGREVLTAQFESLHHQVIIGTDNLRQKINDGTRFCPMLAEEAKFDRFLNTQTKTLNGIVSSCGKSGVNRLSSLIENLCDLSYHYLDVAKRLPEGISGKETVTLQGMEFSNRKVMVWVNDDVMGGTAYNPEEGTKLGLIFVNSEDCTHASVDPEEGSQEEQYYATGFEHCSLPQKQAAVFIQKTFWELGDLEIRVAEYKGKSSRNPVEATTAETSTLDRNYRGSTRVGDRHDEMAVDPENQRAELVHAVVEAVANIRHLQPSSGGQILGERDLDAWINSLQFEKDMGAIAHPEKRAWLLNAALVKKALLRHPIFAPR
jgi:hypothetical protein